jgi:hypothetical protein
VTGPEVAQQPPAPVRPATTCPRCGAPVAGDQAWCTECGLAARTRLARAPGWRTPLAAAAAIGLAAIAALIVAFLVLTGDNAPLPTTAAPAATAPPVDTVAAPATTAAPVTTTPATTTPTTPGGQTVPVTSTPAAPVSPAVPPTPTTTAP